jgi:hypothetical protein
VVILKKLSIKIRMGSIKVKEIVSTQIEQYKMFLAIGSDEETLLFAIEENLNAPFPIKDRNDSFTLGAYANNVLAGVASFASDGED